MNHDKAIVVKMVDDVQRAMKEDIVHVPFEPEVLDALRLIFENSALNENKNPTNMRFYLELSDKFADALKDYREKRAEKYPPIPDPDSQPEPEKPQKDAAEE